MSKLFTEFTNICFKEPDAFPKSIVLKIYNYSHRYIYIIILDILIYRYLHACEEKDPNSNCFLDIEP